MNSFDIMIEQLRQREQLRRKYFPSVYVSEYTKWELIAATSDCEKYNLKHVIPTSQLEPGYIYLWMSPFSTVYKSALAQESTE